MRYRLLALLALLISTAVEAALNDSVQAERVAAELAYPDHPDRGEFEQPHSATGNPAIALMRARMARWEPSLNAVIVLNPNLDEQAQTLAAESGSVESSSSTPLHGLPVLLKDNIETLEMATTAGSLALAENFTGRDAELTRRLREAGLVIAGKTNLSEWANFRDSRSTSGWSAENSCTGPSQPSITPGRRFCTSGSSRAVKADFMWWSICRRRK